MKDISRREAVSMIATGTAGLGLVAASGELVTANQSSTAEATPSRAFRGQHQPRPLPFDPAKLKERPPVITVLGSSLGLAFRRLGVDHVILGTEGSWLLALAARLRLLRAGAPS